MMKRGITNPRIIRYQVYDRLSGSSQAGAQLPKEKVLRVFLNKPIPASFSFILVSSFYRKLVGCRIPTWVI